MHELQKRETQTLENESEILGSSLLLTSIFPLKPDL